MGRNGNGDGNENLAGVALEHPGKLGREGGFKNSATLPLWEDDTSPLWSGISQALGTQLKKSSWGRDKKPPCPTRASAGVLRLLAATCSDQRLMGEGSKHGTGVICTKVFSLPWLQYPIYADIQKLPVTSASEYY